MVPFYATAAVVGNSDGTVPKSLYLKLASEHQSMQLEHRRALTKLKQKQRKRLNQILLDLKRSSADNQLGVERHLADFSEDDEMLE